MSIPNPKSAIWFQTLFVGAPIILIIFGIGWAAWGVLTTYGWQLLSALASIPLALVLLCWACPGVLIVLGLVIFIGIIVSIADR